ncbi:nucleoredoxin-like protein 1 [Ambystoma mexicanum]|uniref:nucleoredoxin-like protein 1 n=1 Tax=Ambystoma mexicanum TaxID=8296 RepID=UPI0037E8142A
MAELFTGRILLQNNTSQDELDTELDLTRRLENRVLLLYFGAAESQRCQDFAKVLKDFFVRLTDEFYVHRASQLVLVYVSEDETEEQQDDFLRDMPKKWLVVPFEDDAFKRELEGMFAVEDLPTVVVLKPSGQVISWNAVDEIKRLGPAAFKNWQEVADVIDRNFLAADFFDEHVSRSFTDPMRRLKYKLEKKKKEGRGDEDEEDNKGLF